MKISFLDFLNEGVQLKINNSVKYLGKIEEKSNYEWSHHFQRYVIKSKKRKEDEKEYHIFKIIGYGEELYQFIVQNCVIKKNYPKTLKELEEYFSNSKSMFEWDSTKIFIRDLCLDKTACGYSTEGGYLVLQKVLYDGEEKFQLDFIKKDSQYSNSFYGYYQSMYNSTHFIPSHYSEIFFKKFKKLVKEPYRR
jgi:hypothetical protein